MQTSADYLAKKPSTSDVEQGYAANIAPRYLTHSRRSCHQSGNSSIPTLVGASNGVMESRDSSRRPSPEKRSASGKPREMKFARSSSPPLLANGKILAPTPLGPKGTPGGKVSNMAKHFERLGRDADRRKYNVIRGRRARPVATARARVEVLESVKDAINESESSDSSSEADDEGDSNEEPAVADLIQQSESPEQESPKDKAPKTAPPVPETTSEVQASATPEAISLPPSPFLSSMRMEVSFTSP
ncbi:hypothetical protein BDZ89DRAFT_1138751 [Hymenopellis radicata]|nr:hypothetical protein BDZ89DRAFT_1138751 [Hymenopellis radicata]